MSSPDFIQAPTLEQSVSVNNLIRFGRKIVAKGLTFTPDEAVEFRELMNRTATIFELPDPRPPVDLMKLHDETISSLKTWVEGDTREQAIVRREMSKPDIHSDIGAGK